MKFGRFLAMMQAAVLFGLSFYGCKSGKESTGPAKAQDSATVINLVFTYSSEKQTWLDGVYDATGKKVVEGQINAFNSATFKTAAGRRIIVQGIAEGSGDCIDEILQGQRQPHVTSPAGAAFVKMGDSQSQIQTGVPLMSDVQNLILSPVVVAMWQPMAEALGWPTKKLGWRDIADAARNPRGWVAFGHPEWGHFKFGHTHPQYSNSGICSVAAMAYAGANKQGLISAVDIQKPQTAEFVQSIESAVVHYGTSTGFFAQKMFANGPQYLSAAVLYESNVIEARNQKTILPVVAIYPREGTFWSDHPIGIVERPWVTDEHKDAARQLINYLMSEPAQRRAMELGFRPGDTNIPLGAPIDAAHGVDPLQPQTVLETPNTEALQALIAMWQANKRPANVVMVFDVSGSMSKNNRIAAAKLGAQEMILVMGDKDSLSLLAFDDRMMWSGTDVVMSRGRQDMLNRINGLFPQQETSLYDAVAEAFDHVVSLNRTDRITAIVVLTDGDDTNSKSYNLQSLLNKVRFNAERSGGGVRIFTIGYETSQTSKGVLKQIADATQAKFYEGATGNIKQVFKEISTFF